MFLTAGLITLLLVAFDLDRPTRRLIQTPTEPPTDLRASMGRPPAATEASRFADRPDPRVSHPTHTVADGRVEGGSEPTVVGCVVDDQPPE
jgi:hypothetical protein